MKINPFTDKIQTILELLGFKGEKVHTLAYKLTEEIWELTLAELLTEVQIDQVKKFIKEETNEKIADVIKTIDQKILEEKLTELTDLVLGDLFLDIQSRLEEKDQEGYQELLKGIKKQLEIESTFEGLSHEDILESLSSN